MALLVAMVALVSLGVFFRYVVDASLTWYDEFASYLLVWLSFYGAVAASYHNRHISFDTLVERWGPRGRRTAAMVAETLSAIVYLVLFAYGWVLVQAVGHETAVSLAWVRMAWVYSVLPISGALMLIISMTRIAALLRGATPAPSAHVAPTATSAE